MELVDITPEDSVVPVYLEVLTEEEQEERDAEMLAMQEAEEARKAEAEAKVAAKEAAVTKLAEAAGLTEEEVQALLG
jgi:hypothetical protein